MVNGLTQAKDVHPENNKLTVQLTLIDNLFIKKKIVIGCQVLPEMFIISHLQPNPWVRDMSLMAED